MKQGTLRAEGKVVVADASGNTLWADRLSMNQVSRTGQVRDILYAENPWMATCGGADLLPGEVVILHGCECTSCRQENPMWRIWAKRLKMKANEKLWAWGVWLYIGRVPVFYVPYFSRDLKDSRPPIEIKPGYSSTLGSYLSLGYNYYLSDGQYGTLRYDWMENLGNGYGLGQHYKFWGGEGSFAGYFNEEKKNPSENNYSFNLKHKQNFGHGLTLLANVDLLSRPDFNDIYNISQVDSYQQRTFVDLQSAQKGYSWSIQASKTTVLQTIPGIGGQGVTQTVTSQQLLPSLAYNLSPIPIHYGSLLNFSFAGTAQRSLTTPQVLEDISGTSALVYAPSQAYYLDGITLTPTISDTIPLRRGLALSGNASINTGWIKAEGSTGTAQSGTPGLGAWLAGYGTYVDLQSRPRLGVTIDLGHRYERQLDPVAGALWSGEGTNRFEARLQDQFSKKLSLLLTTNYDLLPWQTDNNLERFSLMQVQSTWSPDTDHSANLSAGYHVPTAEFKTVDASFNANDHKKLWQMNLSVDWVNNAIQQSLDPRDPTAPYELSTQSPRVTPDQLFAGARSSLVLGPRWKVSYYEQLDLVNRRVNEQAYTVDRDFKCIDLQLYARENLSTGWQYGFSLSLSAAPNVKFDTNQLNADLFNPAQYGY